MKKIIRFLRNLGLQIAIIAAALLVMGGLSWITPYYGILGWATIGYTFIVLIANLLIPSRWYTS